MFKMKEQISNSFISKCDDMKKTVNQYVKTIETKDSQVEKSKIFTQYACNKIDELNEIIIELQKDNNNLKNQIKDWKLKNMEI